MNVAGELQAERARKGVTVRELAERLDMPRNTLSSRLNGRSALRMTEFENICKELQVEPWKVMERAKLAEGVPC